jgi:hypothetical protein
MHLQGFAVEVEGGNFRRTRGCVMLYLLELTVPSHSVLHLYPCTDRASRLKLKEEFWKNRDVSDPAKLTSLLKGIDEVQQMLTHNIVQVRLHCCLSIKAMLAYHTNNS